MPQKAPGLKSPLIALSSMIIAILTLAVFAQQPATNVTARQEKETKKAPPTALLEIKIEASGSFLASPSYLRRYAQASPAYRIKRSLRTETQAEETYTSVQDLLKQQEAYRIKQLREARETLLNPSGVPPALKSDKEK